LLGLAFAVASLLAVIVLDLVSLLKFLHLCRVGSFRVALDLNEVLQTMLFDYLTVGQVDYTINLVLSGFDGFGVLTLLYLLGQIAYVYFLVFLEDLYVVTVNRREMCTVLIKD
jgi:hypothetical protein